MEKAIEIYKESCKQLGISDELPVVNNKKHEKAFHASYMLTIIAEARNAVSKFVADYNEWDQQKWFPVFESYSDDNGKFAGFRFFDSGYGRTLTHAGGGSRLCFKTRSDADWFAQDDLMPLHNDWLVIQ